MFCGDWTSNLLFKWLRKKYSLHYTNFSVSVTVLKIFKEEFLTLKKIKRGTSLEVQLLRLCVSNAVSQQGTRSHMLHGVVKNKQKGREVQEGEDICIPTADSC